MLRFENTYRLRRHVDGWSSGFGQLRRELTSNKSGSMYGNTLGPPTVRSRCRQPRASDRARSPLRADVAASAKVCSRIDRHVAGNIVARHLIGLRGQHQTMHGLDAPPATDELAREPIKQLRVRRAFAELAEIVGVRTILRRNGAARCGSPSRAPSADSMVTSTTCKPATAPTRLRIGGWLGKWRLGFGSHRQHAGCHLRPFVSTLPRSRSLRGSWFAPGFADRSRRGKRHGLLLVESRQFCFDLSVLLTHLVGHERDDVFSVIFARRVSSCSVFSI